MKNYFPSLIIFCLVTFFACGEKETVNPSLYPAGKFKLMMVDFHIAEASLTIGPSITDSASRVAYHTYLSILDKHETDKEEFLENLDYYSARPDEFIPIMEEVIDSLNVLNLGLQ